MDAATDFESMVRSLPDFDDHEQVVAIHDRPSGLHCVIAVHNTHRGPGVGGCRLWRYDDERQAITDALRLAHGMTYKNALAELPFGGGKAVILAPASARVDRGRLFAAFGRAVEALDGAYCTAEDVGTSPQDMAVIHRQTGHIFGLADTSGDPSPFTAYGVFLGIQAAVAHRLRAESLRGIRVAVQGLGHVGLHLCEQLHAAGATLTISDIRADLVADCRRRFGATAVAPDEIYDVEADVYAPCALGATITDATLDRLRVAVVAGAANNQLAQETHARDLQQLGILYAPDYAINAGGIINIACEDGAYDPHAARRAVGRVGDRLRAIFVAAERSGQTTLAVANERARQCFRGGRASTIAVRDLASPASV